jgi:hypothetical protein
MRALADLLIGFILVVLGVMCGLNYTPQIDEEANRWAIFLLCLGVVFFGIGMWRIVMFILYYITPSN